MTRALTLDELYQLADERDIDVDYFPMRELKSVSFPSGDIAIDVDKLSGTIEEKYILAHEIGHIIRGAFYNIYSPIDIKSKHEYRADKFAALALIPPDALQEAADCGICEKWELAEYFEVPERLVELSYSLLMSA